MVWLTPVAWLNTVTSAAVTTAPWGSSTVPRKVPSRRWAKASADSSGNVRNNRFNLVRILQTSEGDTEPLLVLTDGLLPERSAIFLNVYGRAVLCLAATATSKVDHLAVRLVKTGWRSG